MAEREKVIKGLEMLIETYACRDVYYTDCRSCVYNDDPHCVDSILGDAVSLLNAQEPVEPVVDIDTWKCGKCGHTLEHQELLGDNVLFHEQYNYCPECGRAVKWDG